MCLLPCGQLLASNIPDKYVYTGQYLEISYFEDGSVASFSPKVDDMYVDIRKQIVGGKGWGVYYHICDDNDELFCLMGGSIDLSIPKSKVWPDQWQDQFALYTYVDTKSMKFFGREYKVEVIYRKSIHHENVDENTHVIYYYSKEDGLIAFSIYYNDNKIIENFYSTQKQGIRLDLIEKQFTESEKKIE